ncbi:MAG TPA: hypothetical protein VKF41_07850 [Bryobacteraceae bacterium]|nr:hypothetical protein [Bryobacteraceae bacterium]
MKRWHAILCALLFFIPSGARAAEDLNGAAHSLARQTAAFAGPGQPVSVEYRNVSSLGAAELGQARSAFEAALKEAGLRVSDVAPVAELRLTLSENQSQYLLVEEARKGDERQVWMAAWTRAAPVAAALPGVALDRRLVWEQEEQILDVAFPAPGMLVLSPSKVTLYTRQNGAWEPRQAVPLAPGKLWPRDLRGRLRVTGASFQAFLPGMACGGAVEPSLSMECRAGDDPWVLESGSRATMLANFAVTRNHFDGRVATGTGLQKTIAPFYSAASAGEQNRPLWLLALVDGRTQIFDAWLEPVGAIASWGSDIAGTEASCGGGSQVLATRPGDTGEPDAIQAFAIVNRAALPLTAPVEFPGPVTALWPSSATSALAVARDPLTGRYAAYVITVVCGL